jgi:hypothetical protein
MMKFRLSTALGILAFVLGCCWAFSFLIQENFRILTKNTGIWDLVIPLLLFSLLSIPGIIGAYYGFRLIRDKNKKNIKMTVGLLLLFCAFVVLAVAVDVFDNLIEIKFMSFALIATIISIPFYVALCKILMKREGLTPIKGEFIGKGLITLIAWLVYFCCSELLRLFDLANLEKQSFLLSLVVVLGPIIVAMLFYKLAMQLISKNSESTTAELDSCNQEET